MLTPNRGYVFWGVDTVGRVVKKTKKFADGVNGMEALDFFWSTLPAFNQLHGKPSAVGMANDKNMGVLGHFFVECLNVLLVFGIFEFPVFDG